MYKFCFKTNKLARVTLHVLDPSFHCFNYDKIMFFWSWSPSLLIILARVAGGSSGTGLNGKNDIDADIIIQKVPVLFSECFIG